jgi:hypothetical protein
MKHPKSADARERSRFFYPSKRSSSVAKAEKLGWGDGEAFGSSGSNSAKAAETSKRPDVEPGPSTRVNPSEPPFTSVTEGQHAESLSQIFATTHALMGAPFTPVHFIGRYFMGIFGT